jgi:outer membrane biosynthesis protein TonB
VKKRLSLITGGIVIAAIGLYVWSGSSHKDDSKIVSPVAITNPVATPSPTIEAPDVTKPPVISSEQPSPSPVTISKSSPQPSPSQAPILQPEKEVTKVEVPISQPKVTSKPTEPPKPKVKEPEKVKSSAVPPKYDEKQTEPNKETETTPKSGDKNDKGQVYVPGFGWVKDQGGGSQGTSVGMEGDELTGNKVGSMD